MLVAVSGTKYSQVDVAIDILVKQHSFELLDNKLSDSELLNYSTKRYKENMVVQLETMSLLDCLSKRPFFVHLSFDASVGFRISCSKEQAMKNSSQGSFDMTKLIEELDTHDFDTSSIQLRERSDFKFKLVTSKSSDTRKKIEIAIANCVTLLNNTTSSNKINPPLRPDWDTYFMKLATLAASRANCMKRRVGCVIVKDCRVIATGYNGTPRHLTNCCNGGCSRCNDGESKNLSTCLCLHAEENALLEAGRDRIGPNATLYCDTCPCLTCSVKIVQVGIKEVVYSQNYSMDQESFKVLKEGGVNIRQFSFVLEPRIIII